MAEPFYLIFKGFDFLQYRLCTLIELLKNLGGHKHFRLLEIASGNCRIGYEGIGGQAMK